MQQESRHRYSPWNFVGDFSNGIPGWMSFPLAQDVGYDPSIYTKPMNNNRVLVRDVIAEGQPQIRVGLIKPIRFRITPESVIHLRYDLEMGGKRGPAEFTIGTKSGAKYSVPLPAGNGQHAVDIRGSSLRIPASGAEVQILVDRGGHR